MTHFTKRRGERTVTFTKPPAVLCASTVVGDMEEGGPLHGKFDVVLTDDTWGELSWEKAECKMFEHAVRLTLEKAHMDTDSLHCMLGGDLLNQLVSANYAARQLSVPFLGLYSACSTMSEALLIGAMLVDGGYLGNAMCVTSSHFSTAERQFRYPLEMGTTSPPTAQRTVTGTGAVLIGSERVAVHPSMLSGVHITGGTLGKVVDLGIKDMANMGAAMAPAAADTIVGHLKDMGRAVSDYDLIVTGDLGKFGSEMLQDLCLQQGVDLLNRHRDCGVLIYSEQQKLDCGGSGAGCSSTVLAAHLLPELEKGTYRRILFLATGALMSPGSSQQGESIPGIAHAAVLERMN